MNDAEEMYLQDFLSYLTELLPQVRCVHLPTTQRIVAAMIIRGLELSPTNMNFSLRIHFGMEGI